MSDRNLKKMMDYAHMGKTRASIHVLRFMCAVHFFEGAWVLVVHVVIGVVRLTLGFTTHTL